MLKEIFEQFIGAGAEFVAQKDSVYLYTCKDAKMVVMTDTTFPYLPDVLEELIHRDIIEITAITIS